MFIDPIAVMRGLADAAVVGTMRSAGAGLATLGQVARGLLAAPLPGSLRCIWPGGCPNKFVPERLLRGVACVSPTGASQKVLA